MGIQSLRAFLLGNINESVPTDDAIYHRLGVLNFNAQNTGTRERIAKSLGMNHGNEYRCMIKFCKDGRSRLPRPSEEIIPRSKWHLDELVGETEHQLLHPDYYTAMNYMLQHWKPKHDILTICQCSSAKPYYDNKVYSTRLVRPYGKFTDFAAISNPGIIPYDLSNLYPWRYDEWSGQKEDAMKEIIDMNKKYRIVNLCRFIRFQRKMKYKHIITYIPRKAKQWVFDAVIGNNIDGLGGVVKNGITENLRAKYKRDPKYKDMQSFLSSRMGGFQETVDAYQCILASCLAGKDKEECNKIHRDQLDGNLDKDIAEDLMAVDHSTLLESYGQPDYKVITTLTYSEIMNRFKDYIEGNMSDPAIQKSDKGLYYKSYYFSVLDILLYGLDGNLIEDIDGRYHKLYGEIEKDDRWIPMGNCLFAYKPLLENDNLDINKLKEEADKLKLVWHKPKIKVDKY